MGRLKTTSLQAARVERSVSRWCSRCRRTKSQIRLLNATHSCIAWAGTLAGYLYIHEGTHDAAIRQMAYDYVTDDAIPVLHTPEQPCPIDLEAYRDVVLDRFGNPPLQTPTSAWPWTRFPRSPARSPTIRDKLARQASFDSVACCLRCSWRTCSAGTRGPPPTRMGHGPCRGACHMQRRRPGSRLCRWRHPVGQMAGHPKLVDACKTYARVRAFVAAGPTPDAGNFRTLPATPP